MLNIDGYKDFNMRQANNVEQYLKLLERYNKYSNTFFRGQLEKYNNITPSIARNNGFQQNENAI